MTGQLVASARVRSMVGVVLLTLMLLIGNIPTAFSADEVPVSGSFALGDDAAGSTVVLLAEFEAFYGNVEADGTFSFSVPPGDGYVLFVAPPDGSPSDLPRFYLDGLSIAADGTATPSLDSLAFPTTTVAFEFFDGDARVTDAWLDLWRLEQTGPNQTSTVQKAFFDERGEDQVAFALEDGRYRLDVDATDLLIIRHDFEVSGGAVVGQEPGAVVRLEFPQPDLTGTISDANGVVQQTDVQVLLDDAGWWTSVEFVFTDVNGAYTASLGEAGDYRLAVDGYGTRPPALGDVFTFDPDTAPIVQDLVIPAAAYDLRILDPQGDPVDEAWVRLDRYEDNWYRQTNLQTRSDALGRIALPPLSDGDYQLTIEDTVGDLVTFTEQFDVTGGVISLTGDPVIDLSFPLANVYGTVLDGDGALVPGAFVEVQRRVDDGFGSWWDWTGMWADTDHDGAYAISVTQDGTYRLAVQPPFDRSGLVTFYYEFEVADGVAVDAESAPVMPVALTFPDPDLRMTVRDGDGVLVEGAFIDVLRRVDDGFGVYWDWTGTYAQTSFDGTAAVIFGQDGDYRLRIQPPYRSSLAAFDWDVSFSSAGGVTGGGVTDGALTLTFPEPNLVGTVLSGTDPVPDAWLNVQRWDDQRGYWEWLDVYASSDEEGRFAMVLDADPDDPDVEYRLRVEPPWRNSDLAAFDVTLTFGADGQPATIVDGPPGAAVQGGELVLPYPEPNLRVHLTDASGDVRDAWLDVQRRVDDFGGYWEWTDTYAATDHQGRASFNVADDGAYQLRISPPWGSDQAPFNWEFDVADGVVSHDSQEVAALVGLAFPEPNVTMVVTASGDPVAQAGVGIQQWNVAGSYWEWTSDHVGSDRDGRARFALDAGGYRVVVDPPWNQTGMVRFVEEFTVAADPQTLNLVFPEALITGSVTLDDGSTKSRWGWVDVYDTQTSSFLEGTFIRQDGSFALALSEGAYDLTVHPSGGSLAPLTVDLRVGADGSVTAWSYTDAGSDDECPGGDAVCTVDVSYAGIAANLTGNVTDGGSWVEGAFVTATSVDTSVTVVTDANGDYAMSLPDGTYTVSAVHDGAQLATAEQAGVAVPAAGSISANLALSTG